MIKLKGIYPPLKFLAYTIINILIAYIIFGICRLVFFITNIEYFPNLGIENIIQIIKGGVLFDTAGIVYLNILYIVLMLIPLSWRETKLWQSITKWIFIIVNSGAIILNFIDSVYFKYTNRRTTASIFSEFEKEDNIDKVIGNEIVNNYILVILGFLLIYSIYKIYQNPIDNNSTKKDKQTVKQIILYYTTSLVIFALSIPFCIAGIRGGFAHSTRPITIGNANQYVNRPIESAIVLNTPFSIIRTIGKTVYENPGYFTDDELNKIYSPIHSASNKDFKKLNVVIIILESIGEEYIEYGYAPFLKSLQEKGVSYKYSFSNGRKSIDGMPSVLSSIPMFIEPYFVTHYSTNNVSGIAAELNKVGYHTAFFHGAPNGSMGFQAFAKASGWKEYYGMNEYNNDDDFDGMWAIWDEPFMQFFANKMSEFKEPFATSIFTASSHHPFNIPDEYKDVFKEEDGHQILKCVRYTDNALKNFFKTAEKQDWYKNTLFVITADHTNASLHKEYLTDAGLFRVPIIFYRPTEEFSEHRDCVAQQIDIMPTVLNYLNYPAPYLAFGKDLLAENNGNWAINYNNGFYQLFEGDYMIQFDGKIPLALYNYKTDPLLKDNLLNKISVQEEMLEKCKAIIQEYIMRMTTDNLVIK